MKRLALVFGVLALTVATVPGAAAVGLPIDPVEPPDSPVVYAHRGGANEAPENTLGAFRRAHEEYGGQGVWLELDAQLAADGELVVIHDGSLDRTTDCTGPVLLQTSEALQACNAAVRWPSWGFEPVPTLRQVFQEGAASGWRLMVELKNVPSEPNFDPSGFLAAQALVRLIADTEFPTGDLLVQSFFPTSLDWVEVLRPDVATALLTTSEFGFTLEQNSTYATARGYEVSAPDHAAPDVDAAGVAAAHALGRRVVTWTVDPSDDAGRVAQLRAAGVDGIITNEPAAVLALLTSSP